MVPLGLVFLNRQEQILLMEIISTIQLCLVVTKAVIQSPLTCTKSQPPLPHDILATGIGKEIHEGN